MSADAAAIKQTPILLACAVVGFSVLFLLYQSTLLVAGALIVVALLALMLRWPEIGTLAVLFSIYSNIGVLAMRSPSAIQASVGAPDQNPRVFAVLAALSLLLSVPLFHRLFVRKERLVLDRGFILMMAFLVVLLVSSSFARDERIVGAKVADYLLEGLALYLLLINVVRDLTTLRRAAWALLLAGSLMGGVSVYQRLTHTEDKLYGGLAQMGTEIDLSSGAARPQRPVGPISAGDEVVGQLRVAGPIGEPNRYAQILLVLLPLAVLAFRTEHSRMMRALALVAASLILGGLLLTFSRGALLAALVLFGMMAYMRLLKPRQVLVSVLGMGLLVAIFAPGVITRMGTLGQLKSLLFRTNFTYHAPDSSAIHRYVLNVAAWHVFLDHPIFGVGPGHFAEYYSLPYGNRIGLIESTKKYLGHNLYLETLAETGVTGLTCLLAILFVIMQGLWKERRRCLQSRPELASLATAFFLCLSAYAMSAVFIHLSYQRYFWLLVALSSAAARIVRSKREEQAIGELLSSRGETL